jgi:hypothetical protein
MAVGNKIVEYQTQVHQQYNRRYDMPDRRQPLILMVLMALCIAMISALL